MRSKGLNKLRSKLAKSPLHRPVAWFRHRRLHSDDVFLASYPRSGNTWLRFVLSELLTGTSIDFDNVDRFIPEMKWHRSAVPILPGPGRLIKTHEHYRKEYKRAIYIVRDARDVALSAYARSGQVGIVDGDFDAYLLSFFKGRANPYGAWDRHLRSWLDGPLTKEGKLLVIKFEDLRHDPEAALSRMVEFVGVPMDSEKIRTALANNSVDQMRIKEEKSRKLFKSTTENGRFVRKGAVQGWRTVLTPAQLQMFEQHAGPELSRMGYPRASEVELVGTA
jgi:Sulfotransferase domain